MAAEDAGSSAQSPSNFKNIVVIVAFVSVAFYNIIELTFMVFATFKKRSGLYFWSFCVAIWGIVPYSVGFLLKGLGINPSAVYVYVTLIVVGWYCTVTGQSVVLYSRLHLVDWNKRHLRFVLGMIITNGIILHSVTTVMVYGANSSTYSSRFVKPYSIIEKIQVTIFFLQELTISSLYILATLKLFRGSVIHAKSNRAHILRHLIFVNIIVIFLDTTILGLEYANLYQFQTAYKGMAYSIKLKLEFNILNELVNLTTSRSVSSATPNDYIFDGTRQSNTRREFSRQSTVLPTPSCANARDVPMTTQDTRTGERSTLEVKAASSAYVSDEWGNRYPRNDGIVVTRTVDVDVDRDPELERP
ncbi:unnamed protein product [Clonostachys chloroleuca]|uniref:DUF7703 domain-containing protein n=1 Tax=Clonostachys chloroleuca TaxID=1926264 RepID=A0AA35PWM1_9HYPO|nr:unnamed protein product [Clonostachys chloroleuca]